MSAVPNGRGKKSPASTPSIPQAIPRLIVNQDEVVTGTIKVPFTEWEGSETVQVGSRTITRRKAIKRTAELIDFVSSAVYDECLAYYDEVLEMQRSARQLLEEKPTEGNEATPQKKNFLLMMPKEQRQRLLELMRVMVLKIWQQTEEDMDLERLRDGLEPTDLSMLFFRFISRLSPL